MSWNARAALKLLEQNPILYLFLVGRAKNEAIKQSTGKYICFFDAVSILHH